MKIRTQFLLVAFALACTGDRPDGLMPAQPGTGPRIIFDLDAKPFPEIPLPNDLASRIDPTSPTMRRVNLSLDVPTQLERRVRTTANRLEGFGTFAGMTVRFDAPLDLGNLIKRHRGNRDFSDDAVYLFSLQPGSPSFGKPVPIDMGHGNFPLTVASLDNYFDNDPRRDVANLLFDTTDEDKNHNGRLDPGEDTDGDGLLDVPNVFPAGADPIDGLVTFYEKVTNTLILRPILPLEQESLYAVVLTKRLVGENQQPVRSPFPFINHTRQTEVLRDLPRALEMNGLSLSDVAFTWAFTTQGPTRDLEALRRGLYGVGPFAYLAKEFPPEMTLRLLSSDVTLANPYILNMTKLGGVLSLAGSILFGNNRAGVQALIDSLNNIDYMIVAEVEGPNLLADKDGIAEPGFPADDNETWDIDRVSGRAFYGRHKIPFWCTVPRKDRGNGPPFPVAFHGHGYTSSRLDMMGFAGTLARYGIASCAMDAYGHGLVVPPDYADLVNQILAGYKLQPFGQAIFNGRARDLNNDGVPDSGADFWVADVFHTRDMVRQTILDHMVVIRAMRAFDGTRRMSQSLTSAGPFLAGDFDGDGRVDIAGPNADFYAWGHSLGGFVSGVLAAVEPAITAAAPVCGAGGLTDIPVRTSMGQLRAAAVLRIMGPVFVGDPGSGPGDVAISMLVPDLNDTFYALIVPHAPVSPGDRVEVANLVTGKSAAIYAVDDGRFRVHIAADAIDAVTKRKLLKLPLPQKGTPPPPAPDTLALGDALEIRIYDGLTGSLKKSFRQFGADVAYQGCTYPAGAPLVALTEGWGFQRDTPDFRRFINLAQAAVEAADPINYAPHYFRDPLPSADYDTAEPGSNVVVIATAGDTLVPVATEIAMARAAGIIDLFTIDPRYGKTANEVLIDNYVIEGMSWLKRLDPDGLLMDVENFSQGRHAPDAPRLDPPLHLTVGTGKGVNGLRIPLLNPTGQHSFAIPDPTADFDNPTFLTHMVARYFASRGRDLRDDVCMADASCSWIPPPSPPITASPSQ
jgi:hypothetical protein